VRYSRNHRGDTNASNLGCAIALCTSCSWEILPAPRIARREPGSPRILKELIEIKHHRSVGTSQRAEPWLIACWPPASPRRTSALQPTDRKKNLVARYRGTGPEETHLIHRPPDVVEARAKTGHGSISFIEQDGYFYGRGTQDMKESDALLVTTFIPPEARGFVPDRDLILALRCEEGGDTTA